MGQLIIQEFKYYNYSCGRPFHRTLRYKQQQKLLTSDAKLKTRENTKSGANPPNNVFGVFYDIRERKETVSKGSCPIFFSQKHFFTVLLHFYQQSYIFIN